MSTLVFLCTCGGTLNESIDFDSLSERLKEVEGAIVHVHPLLCQKEGLDHIRKLKKERGARTIVVGACSKRVFAPVLEDCLRQAGLNPYRAEIVNIREHCGWAHTDKEKSTKKAERLLMAALGKAKGLEPVEVREYKAKECALVIGGGIAGIQTSLDLANLGFKVYLLDRAPTIGGKMALLVKTYPTDDCAICILGPKMAEVSANPDVELLTYCEVVDVKRCDDGFKVKIKKKPRYINPDRCTGCGLCAEKCPMKVPNEWNGGLGYRKAIYIPYPQAIPRKYLIDADSCLYFQRGVCKVCEKMCPAKALNFEDEEEHIELDVGTIIVATGFEEFDPSVLPQYGYGRINDVITQYQLARILDPSGPTEGKLKRPSDSKKPKRIVMIQCVGSRDPKVNTYCSRYCCMAAMKNAMLIKIEQDPEADITILYKDVRAAGKGFEEYFMRAKERFGIKFVNGDVTQLVRDPSTGDLKVECDVPEHEPLTITADLVVLSCAMVPPKGAEELFEILGVEAGHDGFIRELDEKVGTVETNAPGIYVCGVAQGPKDIPESVAQASAAAFRAAQGMTQIVRKAMSIPSVNEELCGNCGLCEVSCPFGAITIDDAGKVRVNELTCRGCGLCVSVCGARAIQLINNKYTQISQQIHSILTDINGIRPLVIVFCCDECGYTVLDNVGLLHEQYPAGVIPIFLPCLSLLSIHHVVEAIALGADGVLLLGCPEGRCHFKEGAEKARSRVELIRSLFQEIGLLRDKVDVLMLSGNMTHEFVSAVNEMTERLGRDV